MRPLDFYDLLDLIQERHKTQEERIEELEKELESAYSRIVELEDKIEELENN